MEIGDPDTTELLILGIVAVSGLISFVITQFL